MTNPRDVNAADYPESGSFYDQAYFLLNYAVLAPSSHNTQPWLFKLKDETIQLFADTSRALPVSDCYNRGLVISCGAALGTLEVAANFFGLRCTLEYFPNERDHSHLANVSFQSGYTATTNDRRLFSAIKDRATSRKAFTPTPLSESLTTTLEKEAVKSNIELRLVTDKKIRNDIAELIAKADQIQFDDSEFRDELSQWIRHNNSQQHDGISSSDNWKPNLLTKISAMIIRRFDVGNGIAAKDREIAIKSPMLAIIATGAEEPSNWLSAGKFLTLMLLNLTASGVSVGYLNQAIEILETRKQLRNTADVSGYPQLLLRLGKADFENTSARRPLDAVVSIAKSKS